MREDKESEIKDQGDHTFKGWTTKREEKETAVAPSSLLSFSRLYQSSLYVLSSLMGPYAHGLDIFKTPIGTQLLAVKSQVHVVFQVATAYEVTI